MTTLTIDACSRTGGLIRYWRTARGISQMTLALDVGVSARHMSFVETGRSRPSRALLLRLASRLDIPSRETNELLERTGYAREYAESALTDPDLDQLRRVLRFLLDRHEPNPALVFDGHWRIVMSNEAHRASLAYFLGDRSPPAGIRDNLLRLTFHPEGLRRHIVNWHVVGATLLRRVEREVAAAPSDRRLADLLDEVRAYGPVPRPGPELASEHRLLLPVHMRRGRVDVKLFSVLSTVGAALDVALQELRIETFFAADPASEERLRRLLATPNRED